MLRFLLMHLGQVTVQERVIEVPTLVVVGAPVLFLAIVGLAIYLIACRTRARASTSSRRRTY